MTLPFSKTVSLMIAGTFLAVSAPQAQANIFGLQEIKRWNMCDWERIPEDVLQRIENRNDYEDILRRMFEFCPDQALGLTDRPTASVAETDENEDQKGREPDEPTNPPSDPDDTPGPDDNPDPDSPDDEDPDDNPDDEEDFGLPG